MTLAYIGLGSNLSNDIGDSRRILQQAVCGLKQLGELQVSGLYASKPMGPQDQPDYLNAVAALQTTLEPHALLKALQQLEQAAGRVRVRHWGERTLDLDILLFGEQQLHTPDLIIPHAGLMLRNFVVIPLLELDAQLYVNGMVLNQLPVASQTDGIKKIADTGWINHPDQLTVF